MISQPQEANGNSIVDIRLNAAVKIAESRGKKNTAWCKMYSIHRSKGNGFE